VIMATGGSFSPLVSIRLRLATVTRWTLSVQPTCTPRAGRCARLVLSWAFTGAQSASSSRVPASLCVRAVLPLIRPLPNRTLLVASGRRSLISSVERPRPGRGSERRTRPGRRRQPQAHPPACGRWCPAHRRLRRPLPGHSRRTACGVRIDDWRDALLGTVTATLASWLIETVGAEKEQAEDLQVTVRRLEDKIDRLAAESTRSRTADRS
jgi:hypothetical protein